MWRFLSRLGIGRHSYGVKTAAALLCILLLGSLALDAARVSGIVDVTAPQFQPSNPRMAPVTYSITLENGTVLTLTVVQNEGETADEFAARAARMWAAFLAAHGL